MSSTAGHEFVGPEEVAPADVGLASERLERVDRWMAGYVDAGKLPGMMTVIARRGHVAYWRGCGLRDVEAGLALEPDTIFRIYSMTKPIISLALMMLYEEGCFQLDDPVARFLTDFAEMTVYAGGEGAGMRSLPADRPITIRQLLTHTAGLTYGFFEETAVDAQYRARGVDFAGSGRLLAELVAELAQIPLLSQPGSEWNYSVATDVLGHLIEVLSGQPLDRFFAERILGPLGMTDTGFSVPAGHVGRFAANYVPTKGGGIELVDAPRESRFAEPAVTFSGGGGLVSTAVDYLRFCRLLRGRGELNGIRLLGRKTLDFMTQNHLPGDLAEMGQPVFSETSYEGVGFGLGFAVMLDPAKAQVVGSPGEYSWGGAASTIFWIGPEEDLMVIQLTQLLPSSTYPLRRELKALVYGAIVD